MIKLVRIDYRLLHGQVVFAWSKALGITRTIVVNDEAATDDFKKMSLNLSKPSGMKLNIFTVDETIQKIPKIEQLNDNIMLIFGNTEETLKVCEAYPKIEEINYGGIPKKEDAKQYSNAIHLTPSEVEDSRRLKDLGINLYMQQVPTSKKEDLNSKL
ncbi:PTS sugar transporter subunit IIB [Tetragenococcus koreensis]|uniref:Mannose/fructose/sorbose-specific PTS system IID component n=1 Tax=Tetragenococcus koreensis TaxID=290335 RepID=A0AAN4UCI6_9ENTE|nr:PTS sugar transporter subunit IIB [Tetragenococcus koreensis]MDN6473880.1 PTS sugar transporter subunit IIB [Lactococcus lactis]MDN6545108.1 PTS sugar transporter subunit IIB [Enterococcaceae bacterium]MCF1586436.1 PTS sugar transporter subunit IIB [Tetragenococcus koreensis]MCF1615992.1 PTS sugar transporter subunit IIB [Tetragenococcus koreensis]MCF1617313.1 PTS sugar transporter subunit IIB [Tetragenococcus koreensis]